MTAVTLSDSSEWKEGLLINSDKTLIVADGDQHHRRGL